MKQENITDDKLTEPQFIETFTPPEPKGFILLAFYEPDTRWAGKGFFKCKDNAIGEAQKLPRGWTHARIYEIK